jgi:ABC-type branched-subunit amino acid transport system ATPase component
MILRVDDLHASYAGENEVLRGISLTVEKGEMVTIIGPNGAGKSTLFRVIFGLQQSSRGDVYFEGNRITNFKPGRILTMGISYLFQRDCIFPKMTVLENLEMGGFMLKDSPHIKRRIAELLDMFPLLDEKKNRKAETLSGGQRKILVVARTLMLDPKLVLLDEPTAGLDPKTVTAMFDEIKRINDNGTTIVMVEQNAKKALEISDRGYVLVNGEVRHEGKGSEILTDPEIGKLYLGLT